MVRLAALRLNLDAEFQATATHRTNADAVNRFAEIERFDKSVGEIGWRNPNGPPNAFLRF